MREPSHECPITPSRTRAHGHESHHHGVISMLVTHGLQPACLLTSLGAPASTGSPLSGSMPRSGFLRENIKFSQVLRGRLEIGRRGGGVGRWLTRRAHSDCRGERGQSWSRNASKCKVDSQKWGRAGMTPSRRNLFSLQAARSPAGPLPIQAFLRGPVTHNTQRPATDESPSEALDLRARIEYLG